MQDNIERIVKEVIKNKGKIVALTGAGMSEESGIPTFRGKGGLWDKYSPALYANIGGLMATFIAKPQKVINFFTEVAETISQAEPNPGHAALAKLEEMGFLRAAITQNIDNLHRKAGSKNIIELHGNVYQFRCMRCGERHKLSKEEFEDLIQKLKNMKISRLKGLRQLKMIGPHCNCGGSMRPDVVFFGELLPEEKFDKAYNEIERCELLLLIGTSGIVYPAALLPSYAKKKGAIIAEINKSPSSLTSSADYFIEGSAGIVIPSILGKLMKSKDVDEVRKN